jgi:hypothetical protein
MFEEGRVTDGKAPVAKARQEFNERGSYKLRLAVHVEHI